MDPNAADVTLGELAARLTFPVPAYAIAAVFARGFNTPTDGDATACDEKAAAAIDFPSPPTDVPGNCTADETTACFNNERFAVQALGPDGPISIVATESGDTAGFTAKDADGWVRVLDACGFNDHFWLFAASAAGGDIDLTVTDTAAGIDLVSLLGTPAAAVTDTTAFATCP